MVHKGLPPVAALARLVAINEGEPTVGFEFLSI